MDEDAKRPAPRIECLSARLLLTMQAHDRHAYQLALRDVVRCPHCTDAVIETLTCTLIELLEKYEPKWQGEVENRLAQLLDDAS